MAIGSILKRRARHVIAPILGAMLLGYFSYYAVEGERGLLAYLSLTQEIRKATITRDLIHADWEQLDKRVALLRPNSLDPDMLEERALVMLGLGHPDDIVLMLHRPQAE
jgi:cell division protein FtsB